MRKEIKAFNFFVNHKLLENKDLNIVSKASLKHLESLFKNLSIQYKNTCIDKVYLYKCLLKRLDYCENKSIDELGLYYAEENELTNGQVLEILYSALNTKINGKDTSLLEDICHKGFFHSKVCKNPKHLIFEGKSYPVFSVQNSISEKVYVETALDTDKDGKRDLICVYIRRPAETEKGLKVPVVYIANPYMLNTNDDLYKPHNVDYDLKEFEETHFSYSDIKYHKKSVDLPKHRDVKGYSKATETKDELMLLSPWYDYLISRGFAIVACGGIGSRGSEGICNSGSAEEITSATAVIEWLNNKCNGFSNKEDNLKVEPFWTTGKVGMTGKSYLGTLAIGVAVGGVEGLETIVPEAAISNWYDYYRYNGMPVPAVGWQGDDIDLLLEHCTSRMFDESDFNKIQKVFNENFADVREKQDRAYGGYTKFWDERNYLNHVKNIRCSVFIVHGINDWNVKSSQYSDFWNKLEQTSVIKKMLLHRGEHVYVDDLISINYNEMMNEWYSCWLLGVENDNCRRDEVIVQNNINKDEWRSFESWNIGTKFKYYIGKNNKLSVEKLDQKAEHSFTDDLSETQFIREEDNHKVWLDNVVNNPEQTKSFRLAYTTVPLSAPIHINGKVKLSLTSKADKPVGILSAMLVDYGLDNRIDKEAKIVKENYYQLGKDGPTINGKNFLYENEKSDYFVITRGWLSLQNKDNIVNKTKISKNEYYNYNIDLIPTDYVIKEGHKIGLIIYSTDTQCTPRQFRKTHFTIDTSSVELIINDDF